MGLWTVVVIVLVLVWGGALRDLLVSRGVLRDRTMRGQHARFTREDVRAAIENAVDGDREEWGWFLAYPIDNPYLESVRQRCSAIDIWERPYSEWLPKLEAILADLEKDTEARSGPLPR